MRDGLPTTTAPSGTDLVTTAPAPTTSTPVAKVDHRTSKVLACTECEATFNLDQMTKLNTHCVTAHKRAPWQKHTKGATV